MSFQAATHKKALDALARGDVARLKALIHHPVHEAHKRAQGYLVDLAAQAAARGNLDALDHLTAMAKTPSIQKEVLLGAWVEAGEHQQGRIMQWTQGQLIHHHGQQLFDLYVHACRRRHWKSALALLDHDVPANAAAANQTIWPMRSDTEKADGDVGILREVAERLMPHFDPGQVASSTFIAMRLHLDAWVERLIAGAQAAIARSPESRSAWNYCEYVAQEAVDQERLDWLVGLHAIQPSSVFWVAQLKWAVHRCPTLDLISRTLSTVDEAAQQLQAPPSSAMELVSSALTRHDPVDPSVRDTVRLLLRGQDLDLLRQDMEEAYHRHLPNQVIGDTQLLTRLNRLLLCIPADTQKRWLEQDPDLFAPARAQLRQEQAAGLSSSPARTRPRVRA